MNAVLGWLLNGRGQSTQYAVFRLSADGSMGNSPTLIIQPTGAMIAVYWPSGVQVGSTTYVYATHEDASGILRVGLWTSTGGTYAFQGTVLSPTAAEIRLGSQSVLYDPDDAVAPFKMWYGAGGATRPNSVRYATSLDGISWARQGTVLTASEPYETHGLQLDCICRDNGTWRMFYSASSDAANRWTAVEATSPDPSGPFVKRGEVLSPSGSELAVATTIQPGTRYLEVPATTGLVEGHAYTLSNGSLAQRIVVERVMSAVGFSTEAPIHVSGSGYAIRPVDMRKVCVSSIYRDANGDAFGFATGWGAFVNPMNEYVFRIRETASGFERASTADSMFTPTGPGSLGSFENPSPILAGPDCPVIP